MSTLRTDLPKRLCGSGISGLGCSSTIFDTHGIVYNQVCGKIIGYQDRTPGGFGNGRSHSIDGAYVDGISLTHAVIHASTSGPLQQLLMKLECTDT